MSIDQILAEHTLDTGELKIEIRIEDGEAYAALDADLIALEAILYCGAVAEEFVRYSVRGFRLEDEAQAVEFDKLLDRIRGHGWNWVESCQHGDEIAGVFNDVISRRNPIFGFGAKGPLRLELVRIAKENPTLITINAGKSKWALLALALIFGVGYLIEVDGAVACMARAHETTDARNELIAKASRLEGKLSPNHLEYDRRTAEMLEASIAACQPKFRLFSFAGTEGGTVRLKATGDGLRIGGRPLKTQ